MAKTGKQSCLDARAIHEINTFEHRSLTNGVSHKCGHDGQYFMWLAIELHQSQTGELFYYSNPLKKIGKKVFSDTKFAAFHPDYVFALHNLPGYPNQIIVKMIPLRCE
jgi:metal-dependent amidase/aminoacylase/carboxypeptidase family protein